MIGLAASERVTSVRVPDPKTRHSTSRSNCEMTLRTDKETTAKPDGWMILARLSHLIMTGIAGWAVWATAEIYALKSDAKNHATREEVITAEYRSSGQTIKEIQGLRAEVLSAKDATQTQISSLREDFREFKASIATRP